jgi:hypothetical protein
MNLKTYGLVLGAAIATFLLVGIAVTELVQPWIEFSLFVGIPAGLLAGAVAGALVALGLQIDAPAQRKLIARSFAAFRLVFLAVLVGGNLVGMGVLISTLAGVIVGLLAGVGMYLRRSNSSEMGVMA